MEENRISHPSAEDNVNHSENEEMQDQKLIQLVKENAEKKRQNEEDRQNVQKRNSSSPTAQAEPTERVSTRTTRRSSK